MRKQKPKKSLTTNFGGVIDRMTYAYILYWILGILILGSLYFWLANPYNHGTTMKDLTLYDSLYFSVITFSSLGYGDISPIGFGKLVAVLQVLSGLFFVAFFVGKVASERQSAKLRLVYTSEHQRRIIEFEREIYELDDELDTALTDHNHDKLFLLSKNIHGFISSIQNYLTFQSNQGGLASFGNTSSLRRLYQAVAELQQTLYESIRTYGIEDRTKNKIGQILQRINGIAIVMSKFHTNDAKILGLLTELQNVIPNLQKWKELNAKGEAEVKYRNSITPYLLLKVKEHIPPKPWPHHLHKVVANKLRIQNSLAQKCIDVIVDEGYQPKKYA